MGTIHLLCNAHLDPVWLWRWKEGAAEAVSTFRVAADFCEEYEGFVFNHNEAILYEWVEEYEPALFRRIQRLVKEGKWKIMGGWYLQPDCMMPSGESFLSQIQLGNDYFMKKFGVKPTTAINFDPFGHTKGLVQILEKTGYDSYLYMRPYGENRTFTWKGFADSSVIAHQFFPAYNTLKGEAVERIKDYMQNGFDGKCGICLWGVGDHGGGPSRVDMERIRTFVSAHPEVTILHSDAERYFLEVEKENLPEIHESLTHCMVGCYTSMVRVKTAHRALENQIALAEKMMTQAHLSQELPYDEAALLRAKKDLAFMEFHDILPGTAIPGAEDDALRLASHGQEICDRLIARAFFALAKGQKTANDKEIPILIYNPHPYPVEGEYEVEFMLENQNWNEGEHTRAQVYDEKGDPLPTQNEKPDCTFNLDWIQRVSFRATVSPQTIGRFDCKLWVEKSNEKAPWQETNDEISVMTDDLEVVVSKKTGRIVRFSSGGKLLCENTGVLEVFYDNEDPWGMTVDGFSDKAGEFALMSDREANEFLGYPEESRANVRIVENGPVRMKIEALYSWSRSVARVEYTIPKTGAYIDTHVTLWVGDVNRMVKYRLDTAISGTFFGQTAFGTEEMREDGEAAFQKWCGISGNEGRLSILNRGIYGGDFKNSTMRLSLLRTPIYSAHPIGERQIAPHDRYVKHMDMGERQFTFRITPTKNPDRAAEIYNEEPIAMSFFPAGDGEKNAVPFHMESDSVLVTAMKQQGENTQFHFFNAAPMPEEARIMWRGKKYTVSFHPYEVKFYCGTKDHLSETEFMG